MKTKILNLASRRTVLNFAIISLVAFGFASCEKEDMTVPEAPQASNKAIMENLKGAPAKGSESIAEIAIGAGFNELVSALSYVDTELNAGLVDLFLNGKDQYTVFAPTDEAFKNLYSAFKIDAITDLPAELVLDVLLYHVTEGRRASNSVVPPQNIRSIETLFGKSFSVDSKGMITTPGSTAFILTPDISASNGIIHIIDTVLLPIE